MRVYNLIHRCVLYLFSARTSHIMQLAAVHGSDIFSTYVMPKIPITSSATEITGIEVQKEMLFHHGNNVDTLSVSAALDSLFRFLERFNNDVLLGHNSKTFDCPVLLQALESCLVLSKLTEVVKGLSDTRILYKLVYLDLHSYSQQSLYETFLNMSFNAHDATEDVLMLHTWVTKWRFVMKTTSVQHFLVIMF